LYLLFQISMKESQTIIFISDLECSKGKGKLVKSPILLSNHVVVLVEREKRKPVLNPRGTIQDFLCQ
jgi:hypothetical protein